MTYSSTMADGFTTALMVPALASTLRQAQREAEAELHVLADYYRCCEQSGQRPPLDAATREAARRFGVILVEQGFNGSFFFLFAKLGLVLGGNLGGMLAQLCITGNTIVTPNQTQKFSPGRRLFDWVGTEPNWVLLIPDVMLRQFAQAVGRFADSCGYGRVRPAPPGGSAAHLCWVTSRAT